MRWFNANVISNPSSVFRHLLKYAPALFIKTPIELYSDFISFARVSILLIFDKSVLKNLRDWLSVAFTISSNTAFNDSIGSFTLIPSDSKNEESPIKPILIPLD